MGERKRNQRQLLLSRTKDARPAEPSVAPESHDDDMQEGKTNASCCSCASLVPPLYIAAQVQRSSIDERGKKFFASEDGGRISGDGSREQGARDIPLEACRVIRVSSSEGTAAGQCTRCGTRS